MIAATSYWFCRPGSRGTQARADVTGELVRRALTDEERGLGNHHVTVDQVIRALHKIWRPTRESPLDLRQVER